MRTAEEIADIRTQAMGTMTTLLAGIAGVSLIVGGIGIMNIMLVSVTERTREIGLRMAIGAKGGDVLLQFLVEAVALSLIGGGIGIALGFGLAEGMSRWMSWFAKVPANAVAMAFGFAAAVGVFFGFYPAQKARASRPGLTRLRFEMSDKPSVISIRNLVKTYVVGEVEVRALRGVSLDVKPGEFLR